MHMITEATQHKLIDWSNRHAIVMLLISLLLSAGAPLAVLPIVGLISFVVLLFTHRAGWTPTGAFGIANGITLLRLLLILCLPLLIDSAIVLIGLALVVLCLDGLDGWVARRLGTNSEFGEYFDKETDAFFMLLLCWLLFLDQRLEVWVLLPGLMRYLFVVFLIISKPPAYKEPQTNTGKIIFAVTIVILIFCFTPYAGLYKPLSLLMTGLLAYSFADTLRRIYRIGR